MVNKKVSIIGAGKMGGAIIKRVISARIINPGRVMAADKDKKRLACFSKMGIKTTCDNIKAVQWGDVVILAVKPADMDELLKEISVIDVKGKLFISIAAGIKTAFIEKRLGKTAVIRVMPNTPALVGEAASVFSSGLFASARDRDIARAIFASLGRIAELPEEYMDAVTALSGSGPAYFFYLMEALIDAGTRLGIPAKDSYNLVLQTSYGAACLARKTSIAPSLLREMVTSKRGTTEAAFKILKRARVKDTIIRAVIAAKERSEELSRKS